MHHKACTFWRSRRIIITALALAKLPLVAQNGYKDPVFGAVPFDRWVAEGEQTHFHWVVRVQPPVLSNHQRIRAKVEVQVEGGELLKRRGKGQLVALVQISDGAGAVYQSHGALTLRELKDEAKSVDVVYTQEAFVVPGDYTLSLILFDTSNGEHNVAKRLLHVAPLRNDPLADAWTGLPTIEFVPPADPPDAWFAPTLKGRLHLPLETRRPVHIDLLVNASASENAEPARRNPTPSSNLGTLLPALKVLTQVQASTGTLDLAVLDLSRHKVSFLQNDVHELDWPGLKAGLSEANPNVIDVHALERREQNAQFFVNEVNRRWSDPPRVVLGTGGAPPPQDSAKPIRVVVVLSGPMSFAPGEDLHPIKAAKDPNQRIFYIRYRPEIRRLPLPEMVGFGPQRPGRGLPRPAAPYEPLQDSLEGTLKPLDPKLFDVETPEQFRKALATLLSEISRM